MTDIKNIILNFLRNKISPDELRILDQWLKSSPEHQQLLLELQNPEKVSEALQILNQLNQEVSWSQIKPEIVRRYSIRRWMKYAAAAAVFFAIAGIYFFVSNHENKRVADTDIKAPQSNRATITLSNGKEVYLDSVSNGHLAMQGSIELIKLSNGSVRYKGADTQINYNTLNNPRGSKVIDIVLNDGTKVWLNAGSSLTYPVAFLGKERALSITGEAYFEVAHNSKFPFKVKAGKQTIEDIGTSFNVCAFNDEVIIKTTLIEGAVKVTNDKIRASDYLRPGEQAQSNNNSDSIRIVRDVDLDAVTAWKNEEFRFNDENLETILQEVSRWYDVDVVYKEENLKQLQFGAAFSRKNNVSELLKLLEKTGTVHFQIEGKKIVVMK